MLFRICALALGLALGAAAATDASAFIRAERPPPNGANGLSANGLTMNGITLAGTASDVAVVKSVTLADGTRVELR